MRVTACCVQQKIKVKKVRGYSGKKAVNVRKCTMPVTK